MNVYLTQCFSCYFMKAILFILIFLINSKNLLAYSEPSTWSTKKSIRLNLMIDFIANRERFSDRWYIDGHGWSAGYGDFSWCDESMRVLRWKNPLLRILSDDYVRSLVRITKDQAKWRLKKFVIALYDTLEKFEINGITIVDYLDEKEMLSLVDNAYTRGETRFYKDPLWKNIVYEYVNTGKMDCHKVAHTFLKQSKNAKKVQRNGVLARRLVELLDFTHRSCSYDIKFLLSILKMYRQQEFL